MKYEMAKEKIGIRYSARAETDLNIWKENESQTVFMMGEVMDIENEEWKKKSNYIFPLSVAVQNQLGRRYTHSREASYVFSYYILISCTVGNKLSG